VSPELAVDLGTARTLVAVRGHGVVVDEPTVAAVDLSRNRLVAFGTEAVGLRGRCAGEVAIMRPVSHGQLADLDITAAVARRLLRLARVGSVSQPSVLCCASGSATNVQRRALERAFVGAGAESVRFVEQPVAVALGSGLHIEEPVASMVVDVGAGTTEIGVLALGGLVTHAAVPLGGGDFDQAIRRYCARQLDLVVDLETAERVKWAIGSAWVEDDDKVEVRGRDASNGIVRSVVVSRTEVADAIAPSVDRILEAAADCISSAPPDLANDLLNRGLYLAGGGALLTGLAQRLATATGIPVHLVEDPERCAIAGAALCLATKPIAAATAHRRGPAHAVRRA
jgi:rod shape-determining protein MreB